MKKLVKLLLLVSVVSLLIPSVSVSAAAKNLKLSKSNAQNGVITVPKGKYKKVTLAANTKGLTVKISNATIKTLVVNGNAGETTIIKINKSKITNISTKASVKLEGSKNEIGTVAIMSNESVNDINTAVTTVSINNDTNAVYANINAKVENLNVAGADQCINITKDVKNADISAAGTMAVGNAAVTKMNITAKDVSVYGLKINELFASADTAGIMYNGLKLDGDKTYTLNELSAVKKVPINFEGKYAFTRNAASHDDLRALLNDENVDILVWNNSFVNPAKSDFEIVIPENKTVIIKKGIIPDSEFKKKNNRSLRFTTSDKSAVIIEDSSEFEKNIMSDIWFKASESYVGLDGVIQVTNTYDGNELGYTTVDFFPSTYVNKLFGYVYSGKAFNMCSYSTITAEDEKKLFALGYDTIDFMWLNENAKLCMWGIFEHYDIISKFPELQ